MKPSEQDTNLSQICIALYPKTNENEVNNNCFQIVKELKTIVKELETIVKQLKTIVKQLLTIVKQFKTIEKTLLINLNICYMMFAFFAYRSTAFKNM